ncbi:chemotaxis-specific protein-glutamate methyltransferase CheB [Chloroflexia bacterium SDU3-3]|nr:chemotaxis-specific protein-glutamate methyltransferase CheB [Chloroflexia bacterium SDU3-3]
MDRPIRVLVVDDSAYMRKMLRQMLSRSVGIEVVGAAHDGAEALELVVRLQPDVVTTDLMMPVMDGVAFVRAQMARAPLPIVLVSIADEQSQSALAALDAGAVDIVQKPTALASERLLEIGEALVGSVQRAAQIRFAKRVGDAPAAYDQGSQRAAQRPLNALDIIVIGISTGGPQGLKQVIPDLPPSFPLPIVIVLHMPVGYTSLYARSLGVISHLAVREAADEMPVLPGAVLVAPAGQHIRLRRGPGGVRAHLSDQPSDSLHRPSVDVLFQSAAEIYGEHALGIVMTGMGSDGLSGAAWIKARGGVVWTEAEETCVVYGMPRAVVEAGLSDRSIPLGELSQALKELC